MPSLLRQPNAPSFQFGGIFAQLRATDLATTGDANHFDGFAVGDIVTKTGKALLPANSLMSMASMP